MRRRDSIPSDSSTGHQLILAANQLSTTFGGFSGTENQMSVIGDLDAAIWADTIRWRCRRCTVSMPQTDWAGRWISFPAASTPLRCVPRSMTAASLGSTADVERTGGGAYAGLDLGRFRARLGVSYRDLKLDARRAIGFAGFSDSTRGKADGDALQGFGEIGYRVAYSEGTFLEPFVAASVESLDLGEFAETGGPASLRVSKQENTFATATLGLRAITELQLSDENRLRLAASTGAQRNFGYRRIVSVVALNDAPDFGFPVAAIGLEPWVLALSARAAVDIGDSFTAGIDYSGIIGGSTRDHGVRATLGFRF